MSSPIGAYRWEHTDRALTEQLLLEEEGQPATVEQGHAAVRYVNPTTGGDVMPYLPFLMVVVAGPGDQAGGAHPRGRATVAQAHEPEPITGPCLMQAGPGRVYGRRSSNRPWSRRLS